MLLRGLNIKSVLKISFVSIVGVSGLTGCQEKTELLPPITTAPYASPSYSEARGAYLYGFESVFKRPELNYPEDIVARVKAARIKRMKGNKKLFKTNMRLARKLVDSGKLGKLTGPEKQYADIIRGFGKGSEITPKHLNQVDEGVWRFMADMAMTEHQQKNVVVEDSRLKAKKYDAAIRNHSRNLRGIKLSECYWKKIPHLLSSSGGIHMEQQGEIYGEMPQYGYKCAVEIIVSNKPSRKYDRPFDMSSYFVKSQEGQWLYFGRYVNVGVKRRRSELNPLILKNPERAVRTLPFWEMDI